eukprot:4592333-Pyramimonas_sp.AAC.1
MWPPVRLRPPGASLEAPSGGVGPPGRAQDAASSPGVSRLVEDDQWRGSMLSNDSQMSKACVQH